VKINFVGHLMVHRSRRFWLPGEPVVKLSLDRAIGGHRKWKRRASGKS
jgi:hypothetical protein